MSIQRGKNGDFLSPHSAKLGPSQTPSGPGKKYHSLLHLGHVENSSNRINMKDFNMKIMCGYLI